ncbi:MAG: ribosome maturation factor RimM [Chloroflexota bacterium]
MVKRKKKEFITIGCIVSPWGIDGKLKVKVLTDFPERFSRHARVYIKEKAIAVEDISWQKGMAIVKLETVDGIKAAEALVGEDIKINDSQLHPLPEGSYYHFDLIGLMVFTTTGEPLGRITGILSAAGADSYVIKGKTGEILIPATTEVIKSIDLDNRKMTIEAIPGLLDLNQKANTNRT